MHFSNKKRPHIVIEPSWFNPYAVTTVKRILLFKVTKFEHDLQKESNVLSVMRSVIEITECSFLKYLAKTGITIPSRK